MTFAPATSDVLTGVYAGAMILWFIVLWRFWVNQTPLENRSDATNLLVNRWWLRQNTLTAFSIIFLFAPRHILRVNGYMGEPTGFIVLCLGGVVVNFCAIILLHMKDILEEKKYKVSLGYILIPTIFVLYMGSR